MFSGAGCLALQQALEVHEGRSQVAAELAFDDRLVRPEQAEERSPAPGGHPGPTVRFGLEGEVDRQACLVPHRVGEEEPLAGIQVSELAEEAQALSTGGERLPEPVAYP